MPRLMALCELYVSKQVEKATAKSIAEADVDVVGKLEFTIIDAELNIISFKQHSNSQFLVCFEIIFLALCRLIADITATQCSSAECLVPSLCCQQLCSL